MSTTLKYNPWRMSKTLKYNPWRMSTTLKYNLWRMSTTLKYNPWRMSKTLKYNLWRMSTTLIMIKLLNWTEIKIHSKKWESMFKSCRIGHLIKCWLHINQLRWLGNDFLCIITPYIRILDFDWLIASVFFVYFHI
jgi:hypothetical protein